MIEVNTKGLSCPQPLIMAKKALNKTKSGDEVKIYTDNATSFQNLMHYLTDINAQPIFEKLEDVFVITATKAEEAELNAESYCSTGNTKPSVIAITGNCMGKGPEDLGKILIKAFINTIKDLELQPSHIVFYNSGVLLAKTDSDVIESLQELEDQGVIILVCGTCADYYNIKNEIAVGQISNMYTIADALTKAGLIIQP